MSVSAALARFQSLIFLVINMFNSIKFKLFFLHMLLMIIMIGSLSYTQYTTMNTLATDQLIDNFRNTSIGLTSSLSLSAAGENYANIQLPSFVKELRQITKLKFFKIDAYSDLNRVPFHAIYSSTAGQVWRNWYPENYFELLETRRQKLLTQLAEGRDRIKLSYLLNQTDQEIRRYYRDLKLNEDHAEALSNLQPYEGIKIDRQRGALAITLPATHSGGGSITFVYNANQLLELESKVMQTIVIEVILAILGAACLFLLAAIWFTRPLEQLSNYMAKDFKSLDPNKVPGAKRNDEIGILARYFSDMVKRTSSYLDQLEAASITDHLTGLYNRRYFDSIFPKEINKVSRYGSALALLYLDIDNFKKYNDRYGHSSGDRVLGQVAIAISECVDRNSDYVFRLGGEEFGIVIHIKSPDQAAAIAERIRTAVSRLAIKHDDNEGYGVLTVSTGVAICSKNCDADEVYKLADTALYQAKRDGKNCSVIKNHAKDHATRPR